MDLLKLSFSCVIISFFMLPSSIAQDSPQDYIRMHNEARAKVGVGPVTWDERVANYARSYANKRINDCKLIHSGRPYGENIAWGFPDLIGISAVQMWVNEKKFYNPSTNTCVSGKVCGHYTQVVWRTSVKIGCAKVRCANNGGTFIICNYNPPGNIIGQRPFSESVYLK